MSPEKATISVSRVGGAGGLNCQCSMAVPGAEAHQPTWATRKKPPHPSGQLFNAPEAKENHPGSLTTPRKRHVPGPLHISFWRAASKMLWSVVTVLVSVQVLVMVETR